MHCTLAISDILQENVPEIRKNKDRLYEIEKVLTNRIQISRHIFGGKTQIQNFQSLKKEDATDYFQSLPVKTVTAVKYWPG